MGFRVSLAGYRVLGSSAGSLVTTMAEDGKVAKRTRGLEVVVAVDLEEGNRTVRYTCAPQGQQH